MLFSIEPTSGVSHKPRLKAISLVYSIWAKIVQYVPYRGFFGQCVIWKNSLRHNFPLCIFSENKMFYLLGVAVIMWTSENKEFFEGLFFFLTTKTKKKNT